MRRRGSQFSIWLGAIARIERLERCQQSHNVAVFSGVNHIQIKRADGRALQDGAHASYDNEVHGVSPQRPEDSEKLSFGHSPRESIQRIKVRSTPSSL